MGGTRAGSQTPPLRLPPAPFPAERDACGIGFVADASGRPSRRIVELALEGLAGVAHRGAVAADGLTGDGAGVLLPIPAALAVGPWTGLAMVFLRDERARRPIEAACEAEGIGVVGWRRVPVAPAALGAGARASAPAIEQLVLTRPTGIGPDEAERRAYRARRRAGVLPGAYVASLSFRTVTYKALCAADQLAAFYDDLREPALAASFALFHQRFSTNTEPSWERAQPFRVLCHNGEINSLAGNVAWQHARAPGVIDPDGSDSAMLDEVAESLVRDGVDVREAIARLVPEAWQGNPELAPDERAFYRHHAARHEPWDGPAGLVFTDGRVVGAALDRNGLRPLRVATTDAGLVACASEAGAVPLPAGARVRRGRLGPGQMLAVDARAAGLEEHAAIRRRLAGGGAHLRRLAASRRALGPGVPVPPPAADLTARQVRAGLTREDVALVLRPAAGLGHEAVSSMGDDTALAPLAPRPRRVPSYLRQRFAQVTNPAIDHLRERHVMSLATLLGPREDAGSRGRLLELESFFLFPSALDDLDAPRLHAVLGADETLEDALDRLVRDAEAGVRAGAGVLVLTDEREGVPVPPVLAVGAVHAGLVDAGLRLRTSLVAASDEPRDSHDVACLLGYGVDAVCPRLALETVAALAAADRLGGDRPAPAEAQERLRGALEDGVLKVMAKLGIADVASYRGSAPFEAVGLSAALVERCLRGTPSPVGGIGLPELEREARAREAAARGESPRLENPGYVKERKGGEPHATSQAVVESLHAVVAPGAGPVEAQARYERFAALVDGRPPLELRDLLELVPAERPVPLDEVEPAADIVRRFSGGAMSHGSLSAEAHETVARALNRLGARSNSGEGGEDPVRYGTDRRSRIKQVASGRFGVTPAYAVDADELQIKIAQGSKPGEGGQIPGHKVSEEIARLRHTPVGVPLISPPPHHDIYSIEDLAQLVFDLRQVNPAAEVSVKLVSSAGVGLVAAGVAKALADVVQIAGADGGTGASPLASIKSAGAPWELGLAETHATLAANGLRGRVRLRVDGGLKTGRDVVVAALLGADEFSFGTALLLAEGCLMVRSCHLDTCPVGIATQRPDLRAKFVATPEQVETYLLLVAEEVRRTLASLGLRSLAEAVGRADRLRVRPGLGGHAARLDPAGLLAGAVGGHAAERAPRAAGGELGLRIADEAALALEREAVVDLELPITNRDRAVGAALGGRIAAAFGAAAPPGRIRVRLEGSAGQSFGAFLARGVELRLRGEANDGVGKAMAGGRIAIAPPDDDAGDPVLVGNAALYGATGGSLFVAGRAGERFAVRNSGATAVVEGVGENACEYMTGGTVVVLGDVGRNLGAGMSGGEAFLLDAGAALARRLSVAHVGLEPVPAGAGDRLRALLERHHRLTGSARAAGLLADWPAAEARFVRVVPRVAAADERGEEEAAAG